MEVGRRKPRLDLELGMVSVVRWKSSCPDWGWGPEGKASIPTGARTEELGAPCSRLLHSLVLRSTPYFLLQFGRTEVIDNTLNPDFVRKFIVDYFFEEKQNLRFDL